MIGLGNPILGDDGIGWRVAEEYQRQSSLPQGVEVDRLAIGGISLMEHLIGYDQAILIDAITTHEHTIGSVLCFTIDDLPNLAAGHLTSAHDTTLSEAIQVGRSIGASLPERITLVAIEAQKVYEFSEELTPPVAASIPIAVQAIIQIINETYSN